MSCLSTHLHREKITNYFLIGEPSCQKTISLEKASILFNIAALYTQIGARKDRKKTDELNYAVDYFLKAAGVFQHIIGNYFYNVACEISNDYEYFHRNFYKCAIE